MSRPRPDASIRPTHPRFGPTPSSRKRPRNRTKPDMSDNIGRVNRPWLTPTVSLMEHPRVSLNPSPRVNKRRREARCKQGKALRRPVVDRRYFRSIPQKQCTGTVWEAADCMTCHTRSFERKRTKNDPKTPK
jgi:hypothetical protein